MSGTIQQHPDYLQANRMLSDLLQMEGEPFKCLYPTLAARVATIPTKTNQLVTRNSQSGLQTLLDAEFEQYNGMVKTEASALDIIAKFLGVTPDHIRAKIIL